MTETAGLSEINPPAPRPKRAKTGGRQCVITSETVTRIAIRRGAGLTLKRALAQENPRVSLDHWQRSLELRPGLRAVYEQKESEVIEGLLMELKAAPPGHWQKIAWILERVFDFSPPKTGSQQTVNVTTVALGVSDDIQRRTAALMSRAEKPFISLPESTPGNEKPAGQ